MNYGIALEKLRKIKQKQLLRFYDSLSDAEKEKLLSQIKNLDFSAISPSKTLKEELNISPIKVMRLNQIKHCKEKLKSIGLEKLKEGKVGCVLLAGGMGTRLGYNIPKGMVDIGVSHSLYILECLIKNLLKITRKIKRYLYLFIMTSDRTQDQISKFLESKNFFGYNKNLVYFFEQESVPVTDYTGKVYLEEKGRIATSPNGTGGWYEALVKSGLIYIIYRNDIRYLNVFGVDNVLQRIADPLFIGATVMEKSNVGAKVVRKVDPLEKVGVVCLKDNLPSVIEYFELPDEIRRKKEYQFGVILNYLFKVSSLRTLNTIKLPYHAVSKKIPYINDEGVKISPTKPNGYKYEMLLNDMISKLKTLTVFEVKRSIEFAPIKNLKGTDSIESARELLRRNRVNL